MKLQNLTIENFRSFDRFTLNNLGRVNLLVGTNNSGKTTVLEAAFVLMSSQPLGSIWNLLFRRGEVFPKRDKSRATVPTELNGDVRHLFKDRILSEGNSFTLSGESDFGRREIRARVTFEEPGSEAMGGFNPSGSIPAGFDSPGFGLGTILAAPAIQLAVTIATGAGPENGRKDEVHGVNLDDNGGLEFAAIHRGPVFSKNYQANHAPQFADTTSMSSQAIARAYNDIILTSEEDLVMEAVRLISPEIKRIAPIGAGTEWPGLPARDGIYVRLDGVEDRVPLGSMGDGIWRMLGLALAVVHSQNKILLIDEIDTGLHYSALGKMWRFLNDCSQRFNVQIIATTHSRDCYQSLAEICREDVIGPSEVTIQRIDRKRAEAVAYSEAAIIAAADRDVEVR